MHQRALATKRGLPGVKFAILRTCTFTDDMTETQARHRTLAISWPDATQSQTEIPHQREVQRQELVGSIGSSSAIQLEVTTHGTSFLR